MQINSTHFLLYEKPVVVEQLIHYPIWAFHPLVRGTWARIWGSLAQNVFWLLDKTLHSNPLSLYDEKPVLVHLPIFDTTWAIYPLLRGTWVPNLGFTSSECVLWLFDNIFHSNPISLYEKKPVLVHLPIFDPTWAIYPPGTGNLGPKLGVHYLRMCSLAPW